MSKIAFIFPNQKTARAAFEEFLLIEPARKFSPQQKVIFKDGLEIHFISMDEQVIADRDKLAGMTFSAVFTDHRVHPMFRAYLHSRVREII